ncbi:MAG TPA: glycoside hydrolase family 18 protein [Terriglobales bacterium]|jgi:chitinase|nr:glycoside hydrolase family 18 protein [Terriglobales bacterium]
MNRHLRLSSFLVAFIVALFAQNTHAQQLTKRVVADYVSGSKYLDPPYSYGAAQIPYHQLTHIIHAGVPFGPDGSLSVPDGFVEPALIANAHAAGVKVMLLIGGDVPALEGNPALMNTVVTNVWTFVTANGYDGVDLDWEYPESPADRKVMVDLMTALRVALPSPTYVLSIDAAPWGGYGYDLDHLKTVLDFFNVMMYDCAGPWTDDAQLNSPIYWDWHDPEPWECQPGGSVESTADIFLKHVPPSQINMGTPFYGYVYHRVNGLFGSCPNIDKTADQSCDSLVDAQVYGRFMKQRVNKAGWQTYYDPVSWVPYMLRKDGSPGFITYDDSFSTFTRVSYADWTRGLGGSFMWSLDADYDGKSQDLMDAMYKASLPPAN